MPAAAPVTEPVSRTSTDSYSRITRSCEGRKLCIRSDASEGRRCQIDAPMAAAIASAAAIIRSQAICVNLRGPGGAGLDRETAADHSPECALDRKRVRARRNVHFKGAHVAGRARASVVGVVEEDRAGGPAKVGRRGGDAIADGATRGGQVEDPSDPHMRCHGELLRHGDPATGAQPLLGEARAAGDDLAWREHGARVGGAGYDPGPAPSHIEEPSVIAAHGGHSRDARYACREVSCREALRGEVIAWVRHPQAGRGHVFAVLAVQPAK
jgi:hypothetical protein